MKSFRDTNGRVGGEPNQQAGKSVGLSRRQLLTAMGSAAAYIGLQPLAHAGQSVPATSSGASPGSNPAPTPIPGGFNAQQAFGPRFPDKFFHLFLPGPGTEPSTIFNFQGKMAILNIHGTGIRTEFDPDTGVMVNETFDLPFATDVRFMQGTYVGVDGLQHQGTFAFF
jgi:hypothetical protein